MYHGATFSGLLSNLQLWNSTIGYSLPMEPFFITWFPFLGCLLFWFWNSKIQLLFWGSAAQSSFLAVSLGYLYFTKLHSLHIICKNHRGYFHRQTIREDFCTWDIFEARFRNSTKKSSKVFNRWRSCDRTTFQHSLNLLFWLHTVLSRCIH